MRLFLLITTAVLLTPIAHADLSFPPDFVFGLASAPAHAEDQLHDTWELWADQGHVAAFSPKLKPKERLRFWTQPEIEIELAARTGIGIYRLGVDWGRLVPHQPGTNECAGVCPRGIQDREALEQYRKILKLAKAKNLKVMLTLFHHSSPKWFAQTGGWLNPETSDLFRDFSLDVMKELGADVDVWITLNEPTVFGLLTYVEGLWPLGSKSSPVQMLDLGVWSGTYARAMKLMAKSHREIFAAARAQGSKTPIGIAHHFSYILNTDGSRPFWVSVADSVWTWSFLDQIKDHMDFVGMNYYGAEFPRLFTNAPLADQEYSEAGRAVNPRGLYVLLKEAHSRYQKPIFITENGIADSTDWLRPAYMTEHLAAVHQALAEKIPIQGYIFWTLSDNWEWADGYCPKFGLMRVEREQNLERTARDSYELFKSIATNRSVTDDQRQLAWSLVEEHVGQDRPFCRASDGLGSLDEPEPRPVQPFNWRFEAL